MSKQNKNISKNKINKHVDIFDTTLRDGQQCPGAGMSYSNNLRYAQLAANVNIDILEAGFPAASTEDFNIVKAISQIYSETKNSPKVAALCQLREPQVHRTLESLQPLISSGRARLHVYVPVDPELMQASLDNNINKIQIQKRLFDGVQLACQTGAEVEFSPEGYSRMAQNFNFVTDLILTAIEAGANIINCPDTIGGACYLQGEDYFVHKMNQHADIVKKKFPDKDVIWSAHCHNDYGLALTNTMDAVFNGPVRQIEGCFNGIGERAGNVSIEQCIMYLKAFGNNNVSAFDYHTNTITEKIKDISDFVAHNMLSRQAHWPISGDNAARHSSGGHTNAILRNPKAYQPFNPQDVGQEISFVFGPLSGSNHAQSIIKAHGYSCHKNEKTIITQYIKEFYATRRKGLTEKEFMKAYIAYRSPIQIDNYQYIKNRDNTEITIEGVINGQPIKIKKQGKTALIALHKSLEAYLNPIAIESYRSKSKGKGKNALSQSCISISYQHTVFKGIGEDEDIEVSALKALINAVNKTLVFKSYSIKQQRKVS